MKSARFPQIFAAAALCLLASCNSKTQAVGNLSSIIIITPDSLWTAVGDSLVGALEASSFPGAGNERAFEVTQISPLHARWAELREFRHVLVIGTAQDGWVEPVLKKAGMTDVSAPALLHARDVWARNQFATAMVVPSQGSADAVLALVPRTASLTDSVFRAYARGRMYMSKPDTLLRDSLRATAGFGIVLPNVYRSIRRSEDLQLFQNSTELGGNLVRSVLIVARLGLVEPDVATVLAWRDSVAATAYSPAQATLSDPLHSQPLDSGGQPAIELQGVWEGTDPTWPMGGPFIARLVRCPAQNRTYLIDGWLYAPSGQRGTKYEYMIQLQTIMDTFECASARAALPPARGPRLVTR